MVQKVGLVGSTFEIFDIHVGYKLHNYQPENVGKHADVLTMVHILQGEESCFQVGNRQLVIPHALTNREAPTSFDIHGMKYILLYSPQLVITNVTH